MLVWCLVVVLLAIVAWYAFTRVKSILDRRQRAAVHETLIRRVLGCRLCNERFWSDQPYMACGVRDLWHVCIPCYNKHTLELEDEAPRGFFHEVLQAEVLTTDIESAPSTAEAIDRAFITFAPRRCLGYLPPGEREYSWLTYEQTRARAHAVGEGLLRCRAGLEPGCSVVGLFARVSVEWMLADYACLLKGLISVPMPKSLGAEQLAHIILASGMRALVASKHLRPLVCAALCTARELEPTAALPNFIVWLEDGLEAYSGLQGCEDPVAGTWPAQVAELPWTELLQLGEQVDEADRLKVHSPGDSSAVIKLIPTSGSSTGLPKLTVMTEHMLRPAATQGRKASGGDMVVFAYELLKQSHDVISAGGSIGVYSGSVAKVFKDCQALRPTVLGAPPTLWDSLFREFYGDVERRCQEGCNEEGRALSEQLVLEKWRDKCMLGNRLKSLVCSGAALRPRVKTWAFKVFGAAVEDGYGTTETGGLASNGRTKGNVGIQLADCPELGYLTSDLPWPRGEVLASTDRLTPGYFNRSSMEHSESGELRAVLKVADNDTSFVMIGGRRYFRTGDIAELRHGKELRIIDRRKAFFKLSQGLFVAPAPLEKVFGQARGVYQICILSTPHASTVTAVVIPSLALCRSALSAPTKDASGAPKSLPHKEDTKEALELRHRVIENDLAQQAARRTLSSSFSKLAKEHNVKPWEVPRTILLDSEPFTEWNGLISRMGKLCRPALSRKYRERARKELAAQIVVPPPAPEDEGQAAAAIDASDPNKLCQGLISLLSEAGVVSGGAAALSPDLKLHELGLDSMAMARLSARLSERFSVLLPVKLLLSARPSLRQLQRAMFEGAGAISPAASAAIDWSAESHAAMELCEHAFEQWNAAGKGRVTAIRGHTAVGVAASVPVIMVTGATGFLGAFVLDELAKALHRRGQVDVSGREDIVRIVCLVRADNDDKAWDRLARNMAHYALWPVESEDERGRLATEHYGPSVQITAVAGDVSLPMLGLPVPRFKSLCTSTAAIYHCAAHVNSSQAYEAHKPANVTGLAHMLAFAGCCAAETRKRHEETGWMYSDAPRVLHFNHISTQGLLCGRKSERLDAPLPPTAEKVLTNAGGYAQSKYVAEQLLLRVAPMEGVSMRVFRPGVIGPHSGLGSINCKDFVSLLLCGLVALGVVCERRGATTLPQSFNICPVDYVAQSIVRIAPLPAGSAAMSHLPARTPSPGGPSSTQLAPSPSDAPAPPSVQATPRICTSLTPPPRVETPETAASTDSPSRVKPAKQHKKKLKVTLVKGRGFSKEIAGKLHATVHLRSAKVKTTAVAGTTGEGENAGTDREYVWKEPMKYDITRMGKDETLTVRIFEEGVFNDELVGEAAVPLYELDAALLGLGIAKRAAEIWLEVRHVRTRKLVGEVFVLTRRDDEAEASPEPLKERSCSVGTSRACFGSSGLSTPTSAPSKMNSNKAQQATVSDSGPVQEGGRWSCAAAIREEDADGPDGPDGPDVSRHHESAIAQLDEQVVRQPAPQDGTPPVYHLHSPIDIELPTLCAWIRAAGYSLRNVSPRNFRAAVAAADEFNPLFVFKSQLMMELPPAHMAQVASTARRQAGPDAANTRAALADAREEEYVMRLHSAAAANSTSTYAMPAWATAENCLSQRSFQKALAFLSLKGLLPVAQEEEKAEYS